jgi:hypothetical protein
MARRPTAGDAAILREAKERFARCVAWESAWRDRALFDTRFANGDPLNAWQWDTNVRSASIICRCRMTTDNTKRRSK